MARTLFKRILRRPAPRLQVQRLEDRVTPALFTPLGLQSFTGQSNNGCVRSADFNGDGKLDVVMTNYGNGTLTVALGNGDGTFGNSSGVPVGSGQNVSFVDFGFLNADSFLDLVCVSSSATGAVGSLTTFLGTGAGTFTKFAQVPSGGKQASWVGLGKFTADGDLDLVVGHIGTGANGEISSAANAVLFKGDGAGNFTSLNVIQPPLEELFLPLTAAIGDYDGNGKLDIAFGSPGINTAGEGDPNLEGVLTVYTGDNAGGLTFTSSTGTGGKFPVNLQTADLNADGKLDLIAANAGDYNAGFADTSVGVMMSAGAGTFGSGVPYATGVAGSGVFAVAPTDYDLDGDVDIAAVAYANIGAGSLSAKVAVFLNAGKGTYSAEAGSPYTVTGFNGGQYIVAGDFDGKGNPDLAAVGDSNKLAVFMSTAVPPAASQTALQSSLNPSGFGASVTFTATVTSGSSPLSTGTVTFFDGSTPLSGGTVNLDAQGKASFATSTLSVGTHTVTAKYGGATGFAGSTSNAVDQVVSKATTLSTLQASSTSVQSGNPVSFTVTVTSNGGTPAGTVTFLDGAASLGTLSLNGSGVAVLTTSALTAGKHDVTAVYAGNANYTNSTSNTVTVTVSDPAPPPVTPTVTLQSSANPSAFGVSVQFTATVTAAGTPTGDVVFYDGATPISGAVALSGSPSRATFTTSTLSVGSHTITAKYAGATGFNPADSQAVTQVVNPITTTVGLAVDLNPAVVTLPVTLTATVGATGGTPTGSVQFFDGGTAISGLVAVGADGKATFVTSALGVGNHTLTAGFVPTGTFAASTSSPVSQVVNKAGVAVTVSSNGPVFVTQPVTLTADLVKVPSISPDISGQVTFRLNGSTVLGTVGVAGGKAVLTTSTLPVGGGTVTAEYAGDTNFGVGTSAGFNQQVSKANVTIQLVSGGPATIGLPVTFLATLAESPDLVSNPTGLVSFRVNGSNVGTVAVSNGSAQFVTAMLPVGDSTITAEYVGDANFAGGTSAPLTQQILPIGTTVGVGTSATTVTVSLPVTLSATVGAAVGTPAGSVQFFANGTAISGLVPLFGGKGTFSTAALPIGSSSITAQYIPADPSFAGSTSPALTQTVVKAIPGVTLAVDVAQPGQPSVLRAAVSKPNGVVADPGGTVTFKVNGAVVGSAMLVGGLATGTAVLPAGTSNISAEFDGDGSFSAATATTTTTTTTTGGSVSKPLLVGFKEYGVGAGAGRAADARFFNPDRSERYSAAGLFSGDGGVRVTSADFNGDGVADLVAGTGPGGPTSVVVLDGKTRATLFQVNPFEAQFVGGVYVASGDVTGDGVPDLVISPDEGGGPRVRIFSGGNKFAQVDDFFGIDDPNFRGGARAAVADINGDGVGELVVAAGFGGGPRVAVFDGKGLGSDRRKPVPDFFVFEQALRNGAFVTAGDVDGDGKADLVSGGGPGGGPRVTILSGADLLGGSERVIANFFAGDVNNRGGVRVVARDLDSDGQADLVVGAGVGAGNRVTAYAGRTLATGGTDALYSFDAFPGFEGGVYVG